MKRTLIAISLFCLAMSALPVRAATLFWDVDGVGAGCGGAGTWSAGGTSNQFWCATACSTAPFQSWTNNATPDSATIGGTPGLSVTINVTNAITVNNITMNVNSNTFTGTSKITFSGAGAGVNATH